VHKSERPRYLTISEFSKIAEVSRKALIFYDNIGLFSPEFTAENGYRYYSHEQIYRIAVINTLKELGMPLNQIKDYMQRATPHDALALLKTQGKVLTQRIMRLQGIQDMLNVKKQDLENGIQTNISQIKMIHQEERPIFISDPIELRKTELPDAVWLNFYLKCKEKGVAFGYPEGFLVEKENLLSGRTCLANRIICYVGKRAYANSCMPKGTYLSACGRGSFDDTQPIYSRLLRHIREQQLTIVGCAYEERLIDEIATMNTDSQIIRVSIQILEDN